MRPVLTKNMKLEIIDVQYYFTSPSQTRIPVIKNISVYVNKGEFVSLVGPSGSGKSTLLHIVGGLIKPSSGEVNIDMNEVTGQRGLISYMPQVPVLLPWRNVIDNMVLTREIQGLAKKDSIELAREWLKRIGLQDYEGYYPYQLSGGIAQRIALLRTLLSQQELLCLDEPFSALDALTRTEMQYWLTEILEQHKRSVLFVTHSIEEAIYLSDRIYVMSKKPTTIIKELNIPFARPRNREIQYDSQFLTLKEEIYQCLKENE